MRICLRRREFIAALGGAAAWPLAARAQQRALPVIGFLSGASAWEYALQVADFRQGLGAIGYVEGRNVSVEFRWAEGRYERLPIMAADLVRRQVAVIVANLPAALAAKAATTTIPIVFTTGTDPVELGLAASLARPGGNLTGVSTLSAELGPKLLELMHDLVPAATIIALLVNPANPNANTLPKVLEAAASTLGLRLRVVHAASERDFDAAFASLVQPRPGALVIGNDGFFVSRVEQLAALALHYRVPTIFNYREFAAAGGLMSYGVDIKSGYRTVGVYTGRILQGEKPAELPIIQPTKFELVINMKTAKALGITVPPMLFARADELIE
jgi:putative ABC transport system substrate-binding protein